MTLEVLKQTRRARPNLLVVMKGPGAVAIPREPDAAGAGAWDSLELYFHEGQRKEALGAAAEHVVFDGDRKLRKLGILAKLFVERPELLDYERFQIADDDVAPVGCKVSDVFALFAELGAQTGCRIAQPALTASSYYTHPLTRQEPGYDWRRVNFVEIMCPVMTREALVSYLPQFSESVMCWGFDLWWSTLEMRAGRPLLIFDRTPYHHSRPVGVSLAYQGLTKPPHVEGDEFLARHGIPHRPIYTLGGVDRRGRWITRSRCALPPQLGFQNPCTEPAAWHFTWLFKKQGRCCTYHLRHVLSAAIAMGLHPNHRAIDPLQVEAMNDPRKDRVHAPDFQSRAGDEETEAAEALEETEGARQEEASPQEARQEAREKARQVGRAA